uniref:Putative cation-transporting ATPase 13A5 n=1 Tax=Lygus hesperus TaxID=30085 RepID=A0A0A9XW91_LYGHE
MSCVVRTTHGKHYIVMKGSPEAVGSLCTSLPTDYAQKSEKQASKGFRVIALAVRELRDDEVRIIKDLKRSDVEFDLTFVGLAVYVSPLKKDAQETITNLEGGSHRCVIITGDSVQTAISVGKDVNMLKSATQLIASHCDEKKQGDLLCESAQGYNGSMNNIV